MAYGYNKRMFQCHTLQLRLTHGRDHDGGGDARDHGDVHDRLHDGGDDAHARRDHLHHDDDVLLNGHAYVHYDWFAYSSPSSRILSISSSIKE